MRASVARDPDDPIVSFFTRFQTGDEVDLLNMGVGSVSPEGQEIEVETRKVFSYRVASELPEKTRIMLQDPLALSNSKFLLSQTRNGYSSKYTLKNCLNRYLISERPR